MGISTFRAYYPHFVDISLFRGFYPNLVDIIHTGHITSYLYFNVYHGLHSFVMAVDHIYIGYIRSYLSCNVRPVFHIYSFIEVTGVK